MPLSMARLPYEKSTLSISTNDCGGGEDKMLLDRYCWQVVEFGNCDCRYFIIRHADSRYGIAVYAPDKFNSTPNLSSDTRGAA